MPFRWMCSPLRAGCLLMKSSRGFFLVYELLCFGLATILLACAAHGFASCFVVQQRSLALQEAWQAAQMAAAGVVSEAGYYTELETKEQQGYQYLEVSIYAEKNRLKLCSLVQAEL